MHTMFKNFDLCMDDTLEDDRLLIVASRDRENTSEERWVVVSLSNDEAKQVYEYLSKYFLT